jgi:hypothetical protein
MTTSVGAENRDTASSQGVEGQQIDLAGTRHLDP